MVFTLPVLTHIVTGALGTGKTSAITQLIATKPAADTWAVLVNEFGAVGIDQALLEGAASTSVGCGVTVKQLAGGCLCCALSGVTSVAIAQLVRQVRPSRLLIEPSGLGHPAALLDILRGGHLKTALAVQPLVCLVDATQFSGGGCGPAMHEPLVADQIHLADILVGSKADLCDAGTLTAFRRWAEGLYPPKLAIGTCGAGDVGAELLLGCAPAQPAGGGEQQQKQQPDDGPVRLTPTSQRPRGPGRHGGVWLGSGTPPEAEGLIRREANDDGAGTSSFGWVLDASFVFDRQRLARLLACLAPRVLRLKGIWRVGQKTWVTLGPQGQQRRGQGSVALVEVAYRRDSRMEALLSSHSSEEPSPGAGEDAGLAAEVAAAVGDGLAGRWQGLEGLLLAAVATGPVA